LRLIKIRGPNWYFSTKTRINEVF